MSLIEQAQYVIRNRDVDETPTEVEARKRELEIEQARVEKINVKQLASQMRSKSAELLRNYGVGEAVSYGLRNVLGLSVTLNEDGVAPVEVLIESVSLLLPKKRILITIDGISDSLELSRNGAILRRRYSPNSGWSDKSSTFFSRSIDSREKKNYANPRGKPRGFEKVLDKKSKREINLFELNRYNDVLDMVGQKLNPPVSQSSSSRRAA